MLRIDIIRDFNAFLRLEPVWDRLLAASDADSLYMTFDWFRFYWRFFEKNSEMLVFVLNQDGEPVAIVPLMRVRMFWRAIPHTALTFIANYYSNTAGIIDVSGTNVLGPVLARLGSSGPRFDVFYVNFLPEGSATHRMFRESLGSLQLPLRELPGDTSPYILLPASWDEYFKGRNKHFRHNYNRMVRTFEESGEYALRSYSRPGELPGAWEKVLEISRRTWKYKNGSAIANSPARSGFYRKCAEWAAERGWFRLLVMEHKEKPVAFCYDLPYKKTLFSNKSGFDESYAKLSPGTYVICRSIRDAIAAGFATYDLMGRDEEYKMKFTSLVKTHRRFVIFNRSLTGRFLASLESGIVRAKSSRMQAQPEAGHALSGREQLLKTADARPSVFAPFKRTLSNALHTLAGRNIR
jgi:CelD/BcsL family acetyltransferase involved in cellulose biosynthesis